MPPTFTKSSFSFEKGEQVPAHEEGWSGGVPRDQSLWHLDGYDSFEGEEYPLASNVEDSETVQLLARAANRSINKAQPNAGSIQDTVSIVYPE